MEFKKSERGFSGSRIEGVSRISDLFAGKEPSYKEVENASIFKVGRVFVIIWDKGEWMTGGQNLTRLFFESMKDRIDKDVHHYETSTNNSWCVFWGYDPYIGEFLEFGELENADNIMGRLFWEEARHGK